MPRRLAILLALLFLQGCAAASENQPGGSPDLRSLEGPPLAIAGEQGKRNFAGQMEREAMIGEGKISLEGDGLVCAGEIITAPNQSGHLMGALHCGEELRLILTFRPLGPDQGIGLARFTGPSGKMLPGEPLIFYFHPWQEEARRRLEQEKPALLDIMQKKEAK